MPQALQTAGEHIYSLAASANFIQGRRIRSVAAVSLYVACRAQREEEPNMYMLIDFADVFDVRYSCVRHRTYANCMQIDVFQLGQVYMDILRYVIINGNGYKIAPINPEHLILRFAQRLEFGSSIMKVANDATRIVQRMRRDFMTPGRRPAGVCGAALILASRMNNFRRTPREMTYIVKVNEATIIKRLEEFKNVDSAGLTVEEFREITLESEADPPAYYEKKKSKKGKRGRKRKHVEFDDDGDDFGVSPMPAEINRASVRRDERELQGGSSREETPSHQTPTPAATQQRSRSKPEMPPPPIPVDPALQAREDPNRPQTRRMAAQAQAQADLTPQTSAGAEERSLDVEPAFYVQATAQRSASANDLPSPAPTQPRGEGGRNPPKERRKTRPDRHPNSEIETGDSEIAAALSDPFSASLSTLQATADVAASTEVRKPTDPTVEDFDRTVLDRPNFEVVMSEIIGDDEFEDDPEVRNCLLNEEEIAIKTRIWTAVNADWLRDKASKEYKAELEDAYGTRRPIKRRNRKKKRMGDLTTYAGQVDDRRLESGEGLADSAADAVHLMLQNRMFGRQRTISSKINYEKLRETYTPSSSGSRRTSMAGGDSPGNGVQTTQPALPDDATVLDDDATIVGPTGEEERQADQEKEAADNIGKRQEDISGVVEHEPAIGGRIRQQEALDAIANELEDEGEDDEDEEDDEDDVAGRDYDDDPYEATGALSD